MESKTLNMVVIHRQSKWSKFKRRLGGWFSSDSVGSDTRDLPQIIVTSAEESELRPPGDQKLELLLLGHLGQAQALGLHCNTLI